LADCTFSSSKGGVGRLLGSVSSPLEAGDFLESFFPHAANGRIRKVLDLGGNALSLAAACATGSASLIFAASRIRGGDCRVCVAGATESALTSLVTSGFGAMGLLTRRPEGPAPFDRTRDGFLMGEGAAVLVLEDAWGARARGAPIRAYLSGWALGCDPSSPIDLSEDGEAVESVIRTALSRAGLSPGDVDYVNAHGTGTRLNDRVECSALRKVFGPSGPWVSSTKSSTGHLLGAAAAVEAVLCIRVLETGWAPPTRGLTEPDPDCAVRHVPTGGVKGIFRHVLSLNYGLGGHVAALLFSNRNEQE
jgi:3-oxoacyl-(acyl-carrier-protein) synthase